MSLSPSFRSLNFLSPTSPSLSITPPRPLLSPLDPSVSLYPLSIPPRQSEHPTLHPYLPRMEFYSPFHFSFIPRLLKSRHHPLLIEVSGERIGLYHTRNRNVTDIGLHTALFIILIDLILRNYDISPAICAYHTRRLLLGCVSSFCPSFHLGHIRIMPRCLELCFCPTLLRPYRTSNTAISFVGFWQRRSSLAFVAFSRPKYCIYYTPWTGIKMAFSGILRIDSRGGNTRVLTISECTPQLVSKLWSFFFLLSGDPQGGSV
jgi:hypothetical protein